MDRDGQDLFVAPNAEVVSCLKKQTVAARRKIGVSELPRPPDGQPVILQTLETDPISRSGVIAEI